MTTPGNRKRPFIEPGSGRYFLLYLLLVCIGVYFRLDQFLVQVLLDDEWHAIHQLLTKTPGELFLTIGHADFSIPLALLYWLEKSSIGLSELGMRWPMMLAGIITLIAAPLYLRRYLDDRTTLFFTALLAMSPVLIQYARMARPYALTLLLALLALASFKRFIEADKQNWKPGLVYLLCAVSCAWLHLISLPLVLAPFLTTGVAALLKRDWPIVKRMFWLGLVVLGGLLLLVLPPLLNHPQALTVKLGAGMPTLQTYYGVLFIWLGTFSPVVVIIGVLLAAVGAGTVWRDVPITRTLLAGLGLVYLAVLLTQPAWVQNPQTFARYLLPAVLLFLLAVACGLTRLGVLFEHQIAGSGPRAFTVLALGALVLMAAYSPLPRTLAKPNSNTLHSVFRFDYRLDKNLVYRYQQDFPVSPFWEQLTLLPPDTVKVAAAPFSFESNHWDAVRWEQVSRQRVMPGYLAGLCVGQRAGEVPAGKGFKFRNAAYLEDIQDLHERGFDFVVYQKPFSTVTYQGEKSFGAETAVCEAVLRDRYPAAVYEDPWLLVFPVPGSKARLPASARLQSPFKSP